MLLLQHIRHVFAKLMFSRKTTVEPLPREPMFEEAASTSPKRGLYIEPDESDEVPKGLEVFSGHSRAFSVQEFVDWVGTGVDSKSAEWFLTADSRFICLQHEDQQSLYVPEALLFRWLLGANVRIASVAKLRLPDSMLADVAARNGLDPKPQALTVNPNVRLTETVRRLQSQNDKESLAVNPNVRLTEFHMKAVASSLRQGGAWALLPSGIVNYGKAHGLVACGEGCEPFLFPLAWVLAKSEGSLASDAYDLIPS